jgi:hypothetical protein
MPNDLTVQAITAVRAASDSADVAKTAAYESTPQSAQPATALPIANPTLRFDPSLGLVVIEFRNDSGAVTTSVPSERQIAAYQQWQRTKFGPVPEGMPEPVANATPRPEPRAPATHAAPPARVTKAK